MTTTRKREYSFTKASLIFFVLFAIRSASGQFHPVASESTVQFTIRNFGINVTGSMAPPEGEIHFRPDSLSNSFFHMAVHSESINTGNNSRDAHLKEEEYFDAKNYPLIRFVSDDIRATNKKGGYEAVGTLTIKNRSKEIHLPFTAEKNANGWVFAGGFKMNRRDFEVGGSSTISNELEVAIKVVAR